MNDLLNTLYDWVFKGWGSIWRALFVGILAYAGLLTFLRLSGKRTLSKMNAFDLVITVSLGSTLSTIIVSRQTGLADGLTALGLLIALQFSVAWLSVRWPWFRNAIKSEPTLLFYQGDFLHRALRQERVTENEVLAALRDSGVAHPGKNTAVVLETDGSFTVTQGDNLDQSFSLQSVNVPSGNSPSPN
jgi:uncharacterized membrane protein YcaP (DUF421 family)